MVAHDGGQCRVLDRLQHARTVEAVASEEPAFFVAQRLGLLEQRKRRVDLADVMDQRSNADRGDFDWGEVHSAGDLLSVTGNAPAVPIGVWAAGLQQPGDRLEQLDPDCVSRVDRALIGVAQEVEPPLHPPPPGQPPQQQIGEEQIRAALAALPPCFLQGGDRQRCENRQRGGLDRGEQPVGREQPGCEQGRKHQHAGSHDQRQRQVRHQTRA
jgi:hypothetical protein